MLLRGLLYSSTLLTTNNYKKIDKKIDNTGGSRLSMKSSHNQFFISYENLTKNFDFVEIYRIISIGSRNSIFASRLPLVIDGSMRKAV